MNANNTVALADDHVLLRTGLANLVREFGFDVLFEADNGSQFIEHIKRGAVPQIAILDINMPQVDGYETCLWLKRSHPDVRVLALSMYDDETAIIRMIRSGAKGYILKDSDPAELQTALQALIKKGFYHSELVSSKLIHTVNHLDDPAHSVIKDVFNLTERDIEFIKLCSTEMTYKEIAEKMGVSARTVDGYREVLFDKLDVKSRVGLVLFGIKNRIVNV